jgi:hypothetical protein
MLEEQQQQQEDPPLEEPKPSNVGKNHLMQEPAQRFDHLQKANLK